MAAVTPTHDVFISYRLSRSPDREIAEELQKALETYPVSFSLGHSLVKPARFRFLPSRLRVFRDMSDLSATPDLWQSISDQLRKSRWLLVVCSPGTPQSPWISKEIATFLEVHGRERIIAVLVEGRPEDSIPTELQSRTFELPQADGSALQCSRPAAPGASDLRAPDVRSAVALLKGWRTPRIRQKRFDILAPILGLSSRDDLVQRHRARVRRRAGSLAAAAFLIAVYGAYQENRADVAEARAREQAALREVSDAKAELSEVRASEANARSTLAERDKELAKAAAAAAETKEELERQKRIAETVLRRLAEARRFQFADPFRAAAEAFASTQSRRLDEAERAMDDFHDVLLARRAASIRERTIVKHGPWSFSAQSAEGEKNPSLSRDGNRTLVITERKGDRDKPELTGDVYVLEQATLNRVKLDSCRTHPYKVEYAAFLGDDRVLVARKFYVDVFTVTGECVGTFHLTKTKTPVTAAGGGLHDGLFVAGNGAGCVWIHKYGDETRGLLPSIELGAVRKCDDKNKANAVTQVLASTEGDRGMLMFQSGRIDLFGFDGPKGRPRRRTVVKSGGNAIAFRWGSSNFALSYRDSLDRQRLELWDATGKKPAPLRTFSLVGIDRPVDFLGFSADGKLLIGVDAGCALHYWDSETGGLLQTRPARDLSCPSSQPLSAASAEALEP